MYSKGRGGGEEGEGRRREKRGGEEATPRGGR